MKTRKLMMEILARKGSIVKTKRVRNGRPVYVSREFASPKEIADQEREQRMTSDKVWWARVNRELAPMDKWVLEIRNGVELYFNQRASRADGWYWGLDEEPYFRGPFESREAALDDATLTSDEPIKVNRIDADTIEADDHTNGYTTINVVNTDGQIFVCTAKGETPVTAQ